MRRAFQPMLLVLLAVPGCAPGGEGGGVGGTVDVQGRVLGVFGAPRSGLLVAVNDAVTVTDALGRFEVEGATRPYTVTVVHESGRQVHVVEGLTPSSVDVQLPVAADVATTEGVYRSNLTGTVNTVLPPSAPVPDGQAIVVCVEGSELPAFGCDTVAAGGTAYDVDPGWVGALSLDATVHAWRIQVDGNGVPTGYVARSTYDASLTANAAEVTNVLPVAGAQVTTATLVGEVIPTGGSAFYQLAVAVASGPAVGIAVPVWSAVGPATGAVDLAVPSDAEAVQVTAFAIGATGNAYAGALVEPGVPFELVMPTPPVPTAPADGASVAANATFAAVGGTDGARLFRWTPPFTSSAPSVTLLTSAREVVRPDLGVVSLAWDEGRSYGWTVAALGEDDVAVVSTDLNHLLAAVGAGGPPLDAGFAYAPSTTRTVTFEP